MLLAAVPLAHRPLAAGMRLPRPYALTAINGEYGWAAWSFSRQAKLNAWSWHGLGMDGVFAWANMASYIYVRKEADGLVHQMLADTFLAAGEATTDSTSVVATTQWLDFGKPGVIKSLTGIDFDGMGVSTIEVYLAIDGDREGELADTLPIGSNAGGWTYNGEILPVNAAGTEFKLKFIGDPNTEVQINRLTLHWDQVQG